MNDYRKEPRVEEKKRISWSIEGTDLKGQALIYNISASGMLIEIDQKPLDRGLFQFADKRDLEDLIPQYGKLVWFQEKGFTMNKFFCGINFVEPSQESKQKLENRVHQKFAEVARMGKVNRVLVPIIIVVLVVLNVALAWISSSIYKDMAETNKKMQNVLEKQTALYKTTRLELVTTKSLYEENQKMLQTVSSDLERTKAILTQTETMLTSAKTQNQKLVENSKIFKSNEQKLLKIRDELRQQVALLEDQNSKMKNEMKLLEEKARLFDGNILDTPEGKALLISFHQRMVVVKKRIKQFRREADQIQTAAVKEKDRLRTILGNNGYFMKDGQDIQVDYKRYESADTSVPENKVLLKDEKPKVDVTFVD